MFQATTTTRVRDHIKFLALYQRMQSRTTACTPSPSVVTEAANQPALIKKKTCFGERLNA